jgi:hypothetical protein
MKNAKNPARSYLHQAYLQGTSPVIPRRLTRLFNVQVQTALAADSDPCKVKVGFAAFEAEDSGAQLIRRSDAELTVSPALKTQAIKAASC